MKLPEYGDRWRHYKGALYQVVGVGFSSKNGNATVTYAKSPYYNGDELYTHRLDRFLGTMSDHRPRFNFERAADIGH